MRKQKWILFMQSVKKNKLFVANCKSSNATSDNVPSYFIKYEIFYMNI